LWFSEANGVEVKFSNELKESFYLGELHIIMIMLLILLKHVNLQLNISSYQAHMIALGAIPLLHQHAPNIANQNIPDNRPFYIPLMHLLFDEHELKVVVFERFQHLLKDQLMD
jgi:hypothetical protein